MTGPEDHSEGAQVVPRSSSLPRLPKIAPWVAAGLGCAGAVVVAAARPAEARSAAAQDWPPFVLVSGLLLVGLVADEDGLFATAGHVLARVARNGVALYAGAVLLIATVTTVLNLDTSVAFLTPILVYTARSRGEGEAPLLYGCILLSNAGSLLLPGSNLTNLIVLGQVHLSGSHFFREMAPAGVAAIVVTAVVVGVANHRSLRTTASVTGHSERPVLGAGLVAVAAATIFVLVLSSPALPVAAVGVAAAAFEGPLLARPGPASPRSAGSACPAGPVRHCRDAGHGWPGVVRAGRTAPAPGHLGDGRAGGGAHRAREQPPGCFPVGVTSAPEAVRAIDRAEHWPKPVHQRVIGLGAVVESGQDGASDPVSQNRHPAWFGGRPPLVSRSLDDAHPFRSTLTALSPWTRPPRLPGVKLPEQFGRNFRYCTSGRVGLARGCAAPAPVVGWLLTARKV